MLLPPLHGKGVDVGVGQGGYPGGVEAARGGKGRINPSSLERLHLLFHLEADFTWVNP